MNQLANPITLTHLDEVEKPITQARGMPNAAYTEAACFEFERAHLFGKTWSALAFADEHREKGVVTPVEFMGLPLLIVAAPEGTPRVFHNVCSHRGMKLLNARKKTNGLLVCPYHAWSYGLDGDLKATPNIGGVGKPQADGFCRQSHGLKEVRAHAWMGILFIDLSGEAKPFAEHAAPLTQRYRALIGERGEAEMVISQSDRGISLTANCNWKLAAENYLEAYHLPTIHPSLNSYSPLERHYCMLISDDFAGQGSDTFSPSLEGSEKLPIFPHWPQAKRNIGEYPTFYPNVLLGYQMNHFYAILLLPLSAERTLEEVRFFYVGDGADDPDCQRGRETNLDAWQKIFAEDIDAVEGMQRGRRSPGFRGGVFSPALDAPTHHFHKWVARKYRAGLELDAGVVA